MSDFGGKADIRLPSTPSRVFGRLLRDKRDVTRVTNVTLAAAGSVTSRPAAVTRHRGGAKMMFWIGRQRPARSFASLNR